MDDPRRVDHISIHALREEGDQHKLSTGNGRHISIHALREEGDDLPRLVQQPAGEFLSTPSARRATSFDASEHITWYLFLSTPSARRATTGLYGEMSAAEISIHALREEGDPNGLVAFATGYTFLSTPSARRATLQCLVTWSSHRYFYPRPPRGGRRCRVIWVQSLLEFLSTPSARRATRGRSGC